MPLLEIVGVTSIEKTFSVCIVYLKNEREDCYTWALGILHKVVGEGVLPSVIVTDREMALMKAISNVFPNANHILCRWHTNKNVLAKCKKLIEMKEKWDRFIISWNMLVSSSNKEHYNLQFNLFLKEFSTYSEALRYVRASWLDMYKERFVAAWTDKVMHFGNTTTNKVESSHAQLKRQLGSSQGTFEDSWTKIHNLLQLQYTNIKASFEKSKTVVQHNFKPSEFKELRGNISISALKKILAETKHSSWMGIDRDACGCVIRHTHGLPCAHEIAEYISAGCPIPLGCIHMYWRKLDLLPTMHAQDSSGPMDCMPEIDSIVEQFKSYNASKKLQILNKLRELTKSETTSLTKPEVKTKVRGRPRLKLHNSTKRDPFAFEFVVSAQDSHSPVLKIEETIVSSFNSLIPSKRLVTKQKVIRTRSCRPGSYINTLPDGLRPYINHVRDVVADGSCGFRTIAGLMGLGDDSWGQVQRDLLKELVTNAEHYIQLYGSHQRIDELVHIISYKGDCPPYDRWMMMPDMGHLISSHYNVVLYHLSLEQCLTFLPLRSMPIPTAARREIAIGFVNQNHFVQVFLVQGHPVPPIATNWGRHHHPSADGWDIVYQSRIQQFKEIIAPSVAISETIELG